MTKIFANEDNTATFICPHCNKTRTADVTRFIERENVVKVDATCGCGKKYRVELERRLKYRKATNLPGIFKCHPDTTRVLTSHYKDRMTVVDISRTGMRLKLENMPNLHVGDCISVEFRLDDRNQSKIDRDVVIRNIHPPYLGVEFAHRTHHDSIIGFYLFK